jgi:serine/threonine-protein kinase
VGDADGKRLFDDATVSDTLAAVLRAPVEWDTLPASTPAGVRRLLRRCLDRDPKKRLRDIGEAKIALEALGTEPEPVAASATPAPPPRSLAKTIRLGRRHRGRRASPHGRSWGS